MAALLALTAFASYINTVGGIIAPFVAREFGLSDAGIAGLMGFISLGALGSFGLTRLADRIGRRRVLLGCLAVLPALLLAAALAPGVRLYVAAQILIVALYVTVLATTMVVITEELPDEGRAQGQAYYGLLFSLGGAPVLLLAPLLDGSGSRWRLIWALAALALFAFPWVRRSLPETRRFARAVEDGSVARSRTRDLFQGPYRRRAIGLLAAWTLRPIGMTAVLTYLFYHGVSNLGLTSGVGDPGLHPGRRRRPARDPARRASLESLGTAPDARDLLAAERRRRRRLLLGAGRLPRLARARAGRLLRRESDLVQRLQRRRALPRHGALSDGAARHLRREHPDGPGRSPRSWRTSR